MVSSVLLLLVAVNCVGAINGMTSINTSISTENSLQFALDAKTQKVYGISKNLFELSNVTVDSAAGGVLAPLKDVISGGVVLMDTRGDGQGDAVFGVFFAAHSHLYFMDLAQPHHPVAVVTRFQHHDGALFTPRGFAVHGRSVYMAGMEQPVYYRCDVTSASPMTVKVVLVAGRPGHSGSADGPALTNATFTMPSAIAVTASGYTLFTGELVINNGLRKMTKAAVGEWIVSTIPAPMVNTQVYMLAMHPTLNTDDTFVLYVSGEMKLNPTSLLYKAVLSRLEGSVVSGKYMGTVITLPNIFDVGNAIAVLNDGRLLLSSWRQLSAYTDPTFVPPY